MNGDHYDYKFGPKNQWRRSIWNQIVDRLEVKPKDAIVLYLAGQSDLDRQVAKSKNFRDDNLIAIERNAKVAKQLRRDGKLTILGELDDICEMMPRRVDVVFADLCSGLSSSVIKLLTVVGTGLAFENCVLAINLMRGRDSIYSKIGFKDAGLQRRARCAMVIQNAKAIAALTGELRMVEEQPGKFRLKRGQRVAAAKEIEDAWSMFYGAKESNEAWFYTYQSTSGQMFDSGVWKVISAIKFLRFVYPAEVSSKLDPYLRGTTQTALSRQINAVLATRTRRLII